MWSEGSSRGRIRCECGAGGKRWGLGTIRRLQATACKKRVKDTTARDVGAIYFRLLVDDGWVHRQVDSLRLDPEGYTRRHVSLDVTVPDRIECKDEQAFLPLGFLQKRVIQRFDVTHEGKSLPVLTSRENGEISSAFTDHLVRGAELPPEHEHEVGKALRKVVEYNSADGGENPLKAARAALKAAFSAVPKMSDNAQIHAGLLASYVELFADNFMLVVVIPTKLISQRIVIKYSLDQPFTVDDRWSSISSLTFKYTPASCWSNTSYHVEIDLPPSLVITEVLRKPISPRTSVGTHVEAPPHIASAPSFGGSRSHIVLTTQPVVEENIELSITTAPGPQGIRRFTGWTAAIVLLLVLASIPARLCNMVVADSFTIPSPVAPVVLVGPALLLSWIGRSREHDVVSNLLLPLRAVLMVCSLVLVLLAVLAAVPVEVLVWHIIWWAIYFLTAVSAVLTAILYLSYRAATLRSRQTL